MARAQNFVQNLTALHSQQQLLIMRLVDVNVSHAGMALYRRIYKKTLTCQATIVDFAGYVPNISCIWSGFG